MAKTTIHREQTKKLHQFFRDGVMIGTSRYTHGFWMDEIVVYQNSAPKYQLKENNQFIWFLRNCLPLLSLVIATLLNGRYAIFEDEIEIGHAREKWVKPISSFVIRDDVYQLFVHQGNRFSLMKNGMQVALYTKRREEWLKSQPLTYDIDYDKSEGIEMIELFCLFIDVFFFTPYNGSSHIKVIVPHDRYPEHTLWQPKE